MSAVAGRGAAGHAFHAHRASPDAEGRGLHRRVDRACGARGHTADRLDAGNQPLSRDPGLIGKTRAVFAWSYRLLDFSALQPTPCLAIMRAALMDAAV